jgi:hypothetical protein
MLLLDYLINEISTQRLAKGISKRILIDYYVFKH